MSKLSSTNSTFQDYFDNTGQCWEESGSLIHVYRCKICNEEVNGYSRSMHVWFHDYNNELGNTTEAPTDG